MQMGAAPACCQVKLANKLLGHCAVLGAPVIGVVGLPPEAQGQE